jgi:hypothetical protein
MAHQFLLHLERSPSLVKKTPEGVAECVPTDVTYTAADRGGSDMPLLYPSRLPRYRACLKGTREYSVVRLVELGRALPVQQHFGQFRIEWHARSRVCSL